MTLHRRLAQRGAMLPTPLAPNLLALLMGEPLPADVRRAVVAFIMRAVQAGVTVESRVFDHSEYGQGNS